MVERHPWTTAAGTETVTGLTNVVTRPDALGRGLCSRLIAEVHRRERAAGRSLAMLWTRRSWSAHRLYERLRYRDVYAHTSAVRRIGRGRGPRAGYATRTARPSDAAALESILAGATRGRFGFVPRFPHSYRTRFALGYRTPQEIHLVHHRSRPVSYFSASEGPAHVTVIESAAARAEEREPLLDAIERHSSGRWLAFGHSTIVDDLLPLLRERGYTVYRGSHATLMARSLVGPPASILPAVRRTVSDPRFWCQRGDMF